MEIKWLHKEVHNEYNLCQRVYPFWSGKYLNDIQDFMDSKEKIKPNSSASVKLSEFGQYKYVLNISGALADELFEIIRSKSKSLSWKQIRSYFKFISKMRSRVEKTILDKKYSQQAGDTTVSKDGMKIRLNIAEDDRAKWLFDQVQLFHGKKVTWRQMHQYLKKTLDIREEIRDSFKNQEINRNYDENKAEIIHDISKTVRDQVTVPDQVKTMMEEMRESHKLVRHMRREVSNLKQDIHVLMKIVI